MKTEGQDLTSGSILDTILAVKRDEVETLRRKGVSGAPSRAPGRLREALRLHALRPALIAEVKRRSPSAGWIRRDANAAEIAAGYARAGAAAISVLTDRAHFGGSMDDLRAVRAAVDLPVLRKDFVIDPLQVDEAAAGGADAVLLIVAALENDALAALLGRARRLGLDALVEVHDGSELERALAAGAEVIGVNARNLRTFEIRPETLPEIAAALDRDRVLVAESGIRTAHDVAALAAEPRVDAMLVGGALMTAPDPGAAAANLIGAAVRRGER